VRQVVQDPVFVILATGDTQGARSHAQGHLFEHFMAQVMHELGYKKPTTENLNVKVDGVELDISIDHDLSKTKAIAECKAYSTNINVPLVTAFYGRLSSQRLDDSSLEGFFFALPRLTAEAKAFATKTQARDNKFHVLSANDIWDLLARRNLIKPLLADNYSDPALIIHEKGIFCAAFELDDDTRTAKRVVIGSAGEPIPEDVISALESAVYAQGLTVSASNSSSPTASAVPSDAVIVEVHGSKSDFEYQLPASPRYFVGRKAVLASMQTKATGTKRPFVLNAQSGWGKSSLALKIAATVDGLAIVFDTRTAATANYVPAALRHAALRAVSDGILTLPPGATWATTEGALETLEKAVWQENKSLLLIFDQFENVFTDVTMTAEFRDLTLRVAEGARHVSIGYAWKTDYVDWIESHPYKLRDQIRDASTVINLAPFSSGDVDTILRRLEHEAKVTLSRELRQRLREYSQGLPWLLKKLAGHLIGEFAHGITQEQLISEALNVQELFDSDLAGLGPQEREALGFVARFAPILASEVTERFTAPLVQSLLNQRLVVQVGDKLDTYWDIFRDYLNTGRVPIQESYILRQSPNSVARLLSQLLAQGGAASTAEIADSWDTSENVVWNSARELRQLGLARSQGGRLELIDAVTASATPENEVRLRVAKVLRRHKAWTELSSLTERTQTAIQPTVYARKLQGAFPAVSGTLNTWEIYARTFLAWFAYAGLVIPTPAGSRLAPEGSPGIGDITTNSRTAVRSGVFPVRSPGPALEILRNMAASDDYSPASKSRKYLTQLVTLGAVLTTPNGYRPIPGLVVDGTVDSSKLLTLIKATPGGQAAVDALEKNPKVSARAVAQIIETAYGVRWTDSTKDLIGRSFFGWARAAGLTTNLRARRKVDSK
jgi:hypothetical protein